MLTGLFLLAWYFVAGYIPGLAPYTFNPFGRVHNLATTTHIHVSPLSSWFYVLSLPVFTFLFITFLPIIRHETAREKPCRGGIRAGLCVGSISFLFSFWYWVIHTDLRAQITPQDFFALSFFFFTLVGVGIVSILNMIELVFGDLGEISRFFFGYAIGSGFAADFVLGISYGLGVTALVSILGAGVMYTLYGINRVGKRYPPRIFQWFLATDK